MKLANNWTQYKILATGNGYKLEDWNGIVLCRPDPQIIWPYASGDIKKDKRIDAVYERDSSGGGKWVSKSKKNIDEFTVSYKDLTFSLKPMGFKHTGLFPEQAANWDTMRDIVRYAAKSNKIKVLNLFAYTGGATVALAKEGAFVTHVDAAKGMVDRAKKNCALSGIGDTAVRWIVDDCKKFILREQKRGSKYDAIILDPPSYGRGPDGSLFKLEDNLFELIQLAVSILSDTPLFVLLNSYTTGLGAAVMQNILNMCLKEKQGKTTAYELALPTQDAGVVLPCGNSALWTSK